MSKTLKNFIEKNRRAFDDKEAPEGLWEKIDRSLDGTSRRLWSSATVWRAAAAIFMALSAYLFLSQPPRTPGREASRALQGEFRDVESFYAAEIERKIKLINDFDGTFEKDQVSQDLEKLDAMYQVLLDEMKARPTEKVKDALILNLLVRIDLLNQQIKRLEESRGRKESTEI